MKKIIFYSTIALMVVFTGCDDFLEKDPPSKPSENTFWKQKSDLEMALTACYGTMTKFTNGYFSYGTPLWDSITDNCKSSDSRTSEVLQGNIDPSVSGIVQDVYKQSYIGITRMNLFIYQLNKYDNPDLSESDRSFSMGQALFLRAFYYTYLYRCYGEVPLITEPLNLETQYQPKVEASKILDQIYADLDEAIRLLPDKTYSELSGRVTKSAAQAMKVRMMLYEAYDKSGNADVNKMKELLSLAEQIQGYGLSENMEDIFQGPGQENNKEIIFSTKYLAPNNYHTGDMWFGAWNYCVALTNLVEEFEFKDGTSFSEESELYNPENPIENRDPRMALFTFYKQLVIEDVKQPVTHELPTDFGLKKFVTRDKTQYPIGYNSRSDQDWVHLRYGEILLTIAEAENEVNGPTQKAYDAINSIRARKGVEMPPLPAGLNKEQMRESIRHERRIELAFEGHRYFDLKRWRIIGNVMNNLVEPKLALYKSVFEERFYHWPIPQSEIDKNNGVLIQNPNYK